MTEYILPRRVVQQSDAAVTSRPEVAELVSSTSDQGPSMNVAPSPLDQSQVDANGVRREVVEFMKTLPNTPGAEVAKQQIAEHLDPKM